MSVITQGLWTSGERFNNNDDNNNNIDGKDAIVV
jgi:hypothetical protein